MHFRCSILYDFWDRYTRKTVLLKTIFFTDFGHVRSGIDAPDFLEHGGPPTASVPTKYVTVLRLISGDGRHQRCFVVSPKFRTKVNKAVCTVFVYTCTIIATNVQDHIRIDQSMFKFWFSGGTYKYLISRSLPPDKHFFVKIIVFWCFPS